MDGKSKHRAEVLVATPCYNASLSVQYFESVMRAIAVAEAHNIGIHVTTISTESLITRARNMQAALLLNNKVFSHLCFIDSDIGFSPEAIIDLIDADFDVSACPYPRKSYDFAKFKAAKTDDMRECMSYILNIFGSTAQVDPTVSLPMFKSHFVKVNEAGTGFMCIKRNVLERMAQAYPELQHRLDTPVEGTGDILHSFFDTMIEPGTRRYLSEDYAFCRRWKDMGGSVYLNTRVNLTHSGNHLFTGDFVKSITQKTQTEEDNVKTQMMMTTVD
ncbi:hypothetical protein JKP88DRAFT_182044 [Tribonema minus]|nr:hypothetical protein JKP88DRAFT_182044 [Tribonema minus]